MMVVKHLKTIDFRLIYDIARACHKQDGIRGSKDLRAEIRKFLTSTNERKKMSKKTMKQRIALVAVTALTAGVLSVATSPVANAIDGHKDYSIMHYAGASTGLCAASNSDGNRSITASEESVSLAKPTTVTMAVGGVASIGVSGPAATGITLTSGGIVTINTTTVLHSQLGLLSADTGATGSMTVTANSVGSVTLTTYLADPMTSVNVPSAAVPQYKMIFNIVATCSAAGTFSTTYSGVRTHTAWDDTPLYTEAETLSYGAGDKAYINMDLYNGYAQALPATTAIAVSATNGALVKIGTDSTIDDSTTSNGTASAANTTTDGEDIAIRVAPASAVAGGTTTVTVSANGATVATKTLTFLPEATAIVVTKKWVGSVGGEGGFTFQLTNGTTKVPGDVSALVTSLTPRISTVTQLKAASIDPAATSGTESLSSKNWGNKITGADNGPISDGLAEHTCTTAGSVGKDTITLRHLLPVTDTYITTTVELNCASATISTYTVSMDKAAYNIGDIATMTIDAKGSDGGAVSDFAVVGTTDTSAGGGTITKATATTDAFSAGKRTYTFQMTTAGTFNGLSAISGLVTKSATAKYTVTDPLSGVSNAQVLQSIVALIASINKQIQALQALILKKK